MEQRLQAIRAQLAKHDGAAFLITCPMNRRYLTGFTGSSGYAIVTKETSILITDSRYTTQSKHEAPDWTVVLHRESILETVGEKCQELGVTSLLFEAEHVTFQDYTELQSYVPHIQLVPTLEWVERLRKQKTEVEINWIRAAAEIVDRTFAQIIQELKPGMTEREIALRMDFLMRQFGASGSAFETIVASGERSALPHGLASDKVLEKGDLVLMDFGARVQGYTSDMTRTVVLGQANEKQREIYHVVLGALRKTIEQVKPNMTGKQVDHIAREWIAEHGYNDYFGHATGHGIGLDVHELPVLRRTSEEILSEAMVVTIEPGIYLPGMGGVRIEDDILLTPTGCVRLTQAPQELIEIACE